MLQEMLIIAGIRTRNALQVPEYRLPSSGVFIANIDGIDAMDPNRGNPTAEQAESLPELVPDVDERIWRDYCIELQRYLEGPLWQSGASGTMAIPRPIVSPWAMFSPTAKATYSRIAATIESALQRQPSSTVLWGLWMTLKKTGAGSSMGQLLEILQPSPTVAAANWPPPSIRTEYLNFCRERGDWRAIQELVEPTWDSMVSRGNLFAQANRNINFQVQSADGPQSMSINLSPYNQGFWLSNGAAYLEALLRLGRTNDADSMMRTWAANSGWEGAFSAAAEIAERLRYESLARSWRALGEKK
jgi:hypothetical protein